MNALKTQVRHYQHHITKKRFCLTKLGIKSPHQFYKFFSQFYSLMMRSKRYEIQIPKNHSTGHRWSAGHFVPCSAYHVFREKLECGSARFFLFLGISRLRFTEESMYQILPRFLIYIQGQILFIKRKTVKVLLNAKKRFVLPLSANG